MNATPTPPPLRTILAAVGFSAASRDAMIQAARLAGVGTGGTTAEMGETDLRVLHVVPSEAAECHIMDWPTADCDAEAALASRARTLLVTLVSEVLPTERRSNEGGGSAVATGCGKVHADITVGSPLREILRAVKSSHADLLVMGLSERTGLHGAGTLASACLRKAPTKVLLARPGHTGSFRTIVVGVDFSDTSRRALVQAFRVARQDGSVVHVLHAFSGPWQQWPYRGAAPEARPDAIRQYTDGLQRRLEAFAGDIGVEVAGVNTTFAVVDGQSHGDVLADYAREHDADLIVMGTRGRTNLRYVLLGSTAERIVREAPCSILAVKPDEFSIDID